MKGLFATGGITAAVALVLFIGITLVLLLIATQSTMTKIEWDEETYIVKSGDTLWTIADKYCPEIVDKREWIHEVQELNDIHSSTIHPGQRLKVLAPKG